MRGVQTVWNVKENFNFAFSLYVTPLTLMYAPAFMAAFAVASAADHPPKTITGFAASYGSNMVLQQAPQQAVVWGWATSSSGISLKLSSADSSSKVHDATIQQITSTTYTWRVLLPAQAASTDPTKGGAAVPYTLTLLSGGNVTAYVN